MKSEYQKFEIVTVRRSELHAHPKNPRQISDAAKKKLKDKMKQSGLLQPIIVNQRDGVMYVLGGHQRLATMDSLERYQDGKNDYELDVSLVRLPEKDELEMLVFLNNPSAQGTWDTELLAELNQDLGIDFGDMGFDRLDIDLLFDGDGRFSDMFADTTEVSEAKDALREIKEHRAEAADKFKDKNSAGFYFTVVCRDEAEKKEVLAKLHIPHYEQYVSGEAVLQAVGDD